MEDLSFVSRIDHAPEIAFDDAETCTEADARPPSPQPAYRAASLLDSLSAYAALFACSAGCATAGA